MKKILQIVPHFPGELDGVGDYAQTLGREIQGRTGAVTSYAAPKGIAPEGSLLLKDAGSTRFDAAILHYVNYGYDERGVPASLPGLVESAFTGVDGARLVIFHELYPFAHPWQRDFWTMRKQKEIIRQLVVLTTFALVSNLVAAAQLQDLSPTVNYSIQPVSSNFGEPVLEEEELAQRMEDRWVICGGTFLLRRSLRSLIKANLPARHQIKELLIVGGQSDREIQAQLGKVNVKKAEYYPAVSAAQGSKLLSTASYGWLDYFTGRVSASAILKSTSFAALCAHGIVPVLGSGLPPLTAGEVQLPVLYGSSDEMLSKSKRVAAAQALYRWYQAEASHSVRMEHVLEKLGLENSSHPSLFDGN